MRIPSTTRINTVIASCSDRSGLRDLLDRLAEQNPDLEVFASSGTRVSLSAGQPPGFALSDISALSGVGAMPGGLVKTLSPSLFAGILAEPGDREQASYLREIGGREVDLVIANLYPFREAASVEDTDAEILRSSIDIGGSALIRAAAKNFLRVAVLVDPAQYPAFIGHVREHRGVTPDARIGLAGRAFALSADYDAHITRWFERKLQATDYTVSEPSDMPEDGGGRAE